LHRTPRGNVMPSWLHGPYSRIWGLGHSPERPLLASLAKFANQQNGELQQENGGHNLVTGKQ
jgi:hypothetical protein